MSFLSVLKSIGHAVKTAVTDIEPYQGLLAAVPGFGPLILSAVTAAEQLVTTASSGAVKKAIVTQIVNTVQPGIPPDSLSGIIDQVVAGLKMLDAALAKLPPPAPVVAPAAKP